MDKALYKLLSDLEEIARYYKMHDCEADHADLRKVLDEYYESVGNKARFKVGDKVKTISDWEKYNCKSPIVGTVTSIEVNTYTKFCEQMDGTIRSTKEMKNVTMITIDGDEDHKLNESWFELDE